MSKNYYEIGVKLALAEAGLAKVAVPLKELLLHPAVLGTGMGALGNVLAGGEAPMWERALRGGTAGGAIGAGIRYLPKLIAKKAPSLSPYAGDLGWMAPSLLAAPVILGAGDTHGNKGRRGFRGK